MDELIEGRATTNLQKQHLLERLYRVWASAPTLRLGQLLVGSQAAAEKKIDLFYVEDDELIKDVEQFDVLLHAVEKRNNG